MGEFVLGAKVWSPQEAVVLEFVEPVVDDWYTVFHEFGCRILTVIWRHDYTENRKMDIRITIDGVIHLDANSDYAANDDFWLAFVTQNRLRDLSYDTTARTLNLYDKWTAGKDILIEIRTRELIDGGKKILTFCEWEKMEG